MFVSLILFLSHWVVTHSLVFQLTSFVFFSPVPMWCMWRMWRLIQKQTHFKSVYCCKAMVLSGILNVIFNFLCQMDKKSMLLGWFWQIGILLNNVVLALDMKSHKSNLCNLSVVLFCSASANIIKFSSNYNANNVTFSTKIVSIFFVNLWSQRLVVNQPKNDIWWYTLECKFSH